MTQEQHTDSQSEQAPGNPLRWRDVQRLNTAFMKHIHGNWDLYAASLPHLRRTLSVYSDFTYAVKFLPEDQRGNGIGFINPGESLREDLPVLFGAAYTMEVEHLIQGAFVDRTQTHGVYEEPNEDSPEGLMRKYPLSYPTLEQAQVAIDDPTSTDYAWFNGVKRRLAAPGVPDSWFAGWMSVEEFPAQKKLLDRVRNHPRISYGMKLMEAAWEEVRQKEDAQENALRIFNELKQQAEVATDPQVRRNLVREAARVMDGYPQ